MELKTSTNDWKSASPRVRPVDYPPLSASLQPTPPEILMVASALEPDPSTDTWTTGLFDCFDDVSNCYLTALCPCVTFGQNAEIIDRGVTPCALAGTILVIVSCACWLTCIYRTRLRGLYGLPGDQYHDFCIHLCCTSCAFCQEFRELKNRGYDPSFGWYENQRRRGQLPANPIFNMPPAVPNGMYRHDDDKAKS